MNDGFNATLKFDSTKMNTKNGKAQYYPNMYLLRKTLGWDANQPHVEMLTLQFRKPPPPPHSTHD